MNESIKPACQGVPNTISYPQQSGDSNTIDEKDSLPAAPQLHQVTVSNQSQIEFKIASNDLTEIDIQMQEQGSQI